MLALLNGEMIEAERATIPASDEGFLYGRGVFTTTRVQDGVPWFFEDHIKRLETTARMLGIEADLFTVDQIQSLALKSGAMRGAYKLRMTVTKQTRLATLEAIDPKVSAVRLTTKQVGYGAVLKTLAYLDRYRLKEEAAEKGYDDVVTIDPDGHILETSFANLFWIHDQTLYYPDPSLSLLFGTALTNIIAMGHKLGVSCSPVKQRKIPKDAKVYLCNSLRGVIPVKSIDQ